MTSGPNVLSIVLAGGEGKRLMPLTADRAKPAVPFGGTYRLIDFVLSNLVNSDLTKVCVLTQYKSHSLDRHISVTWRMSVLLGSYVTSVPAQQRTGKQWYQGSADAIYQSMNLINDEDPDYVVVFGADNIYRMNVEDMVKAHIDSGLDATVAGIRVPRREASAFGIIDAAPDGKINAFLEKPADPPGLPDSPEESFASMGNYIFTKDAFVKCLTEDAAVRVLSAEGKLSAWILSLLPFATALMINLVSPGFMAVLWEDPAGLNLILMTCAGMVVGIFWLWRIVQIRV